jgi:hypothetical protein
VSFWPWDVKREAKRGEKRGKEAKKRRKVSILNKN